MLSATSSTVAFMREETHLILWSSIDIVLCIKQQTPSHNEMSQQVNTLRGQQQREWDMRTVRELLQLAGVNMAALLERHEVMSACQQQLDKKPKAVGLALLQPKTCMSSAGTYRH